MFRLCVPTRTAKAPRPCTPWPGVSDDALVSLTPLPPMDSAAAAAMWTAYAEAHPDAVAGQDPPPVEAFGDSVELADELIALVLHGPKRATAGLVSAYVRDGEALPRIGGYWVGCDGSGTPRAILRAYALRVGPVISVDDAFAWDEGEGDRSRDDWLRAHRDFFSRTCEAAGAAYDDSLEAVFERFRVVWPPEVAD